MDKIVKQIQVRAMCAVCVCVVCVCCYSFAYRVSRCFPVQGTKATKKELEELQEWLKKQDGAVFFFLLLFFSFLR